MCKLRSLSNLRHAFPSCVDAGGSRLSLGSGEGGAIDLAGPSPSAQPHKGRKAHGMKVGA